MAFKVGMCFSRPLKGERPLRHIGKKAPVYKRLLEFCQHRGWQAFVLTRLTYQEKGIFKGGWLLKKGKFRRLTMPVKINLVYDRTGGLDFPPKKDSGVIFVNQRRFKLLCWNKWLAYQEIGEFMPKTFWVGGKENLPTVLAKIKSDWLVLKPHNGLKGIGIFIGDKKKALAFEFSQKFPEYIAQEFVKTSGGIKGITTGSHDLRVVITNGRPIYSQVRRPPAGTFFNISSGGKIKQVDYFKKVPELIKKVVELIAPKFCQKYDNPLFSLDFGMGENGPKIFEINDQIAFPRWHWEFRDVFLQELVDNFENKLKNKA